MLIQDPDCLPGILDKISEEKLEGIVDISFPVFAEITIIKYTKDTKYSFEEKEYILYGQEVPDFHILTYDYLWSVFAASLKEVDRQQQADKARIAELENQVSNLEATVGSLESTVASQQSLINDILERLKKVERA